MKNKLKEVKYIFVFGGVLSGLGKGIVASSLGYLLKSLDLKITIQTINDTELLCKKKQQISKIIFFNFFTSLCKKANNFS